MDLVTLVLQVHLAPLDLLDLLFPSTHSEDLTITPDITQLLKERKVIEDHQGQLKLQVQGRLLIFTLYGMS